MPDTRSDLFDVSVDLLGATDVALSTLSREAIVRLMQAMRRDLEGYVSLHQQLHDMCETFGIPEGSNRVIWLRTQLHELNELRMTLKQINDADLEIEAHRAARRAARAAAKTKVRRGR